jgi:adenylate kinase
MRIILLGPPGSGKSIISRKIADKYGFPVVSVEEVAEELSAMAQQDDDMGRQAKESISSGRVSDDVCNTVLKRVLGKDELGDGFVLVGYPKDAAQADYIETAMNQIRRPLDLVMMIDIDRDELMERRVGRIDCDACGTHYNLYVNPPMVEGVCDLCGSRVSRRPRGYEENIANQLREYDVAIQPVLDFFTQLNKLQTVDANGTEEQLWAHVQKTIDATEPVVLEDLPDNPKEKKSGAADKEKSAAKKTTAAKKAVTKKSVVKKAEEKIKADKKKKTAKKAEKKKVATKKKVAAKKTGAKAKVPESGKKKIVKKAAARKAASKKKVVKAAAKKKVAAKKKAARKKPVQKKVVKKKTVKKAVAKKTAPKKKVVKKVATKKKVAKKTKVSTKKKPSKPKAVKKASRKKVSAPRKKATSKKKIVKKPAKKAPVKKKIARKKVAKKKVAKKKATKNR